MLSVEDIDLRAVAGELQRRFGETLDEGYLDGRTVLRDAIERHLGCSLLEAEELVDTLEANGFLRFPHMADATHSRRAAQWSIAAHD